MGQIYRGRVEVWLLGLLGVIGLNGCGLPPGQPLSRQGRPRVVATSTLIADWAGQIGGDSIELTGLLRAGADPHVYEPVPADTIALERADLILYNGYNLEPGLIRLINAAGVKARRVALGEVVPALTSHHTATTVPDPHVWGDVGNVVPMVETLRDQLISLVPAQRQVFSQRAQAYIGQLNRVDHWIKHQTATVPPSRRYLVTTHDAFQYYARAYGLQVVGTLIGISTEEQPSARTMQYLVTSIRSVGVPAIFAETTLNPNLITTVAGEAGVRLAPTPLYSDSIGAVGSPGDSYLKMMAANTRVIVENLGGRVQTLSLPN
ncbi:MAG: zinc ABC transporter substrate-binding protein [Cyanobacteria bacterium REEB459]|nr:zinc ABC transporter substrate-binding protein [Cyanobacteria bacterium REEB459]